MTERDAPSSPGLSEFAGQGLCLGPFSNTLTVTHIFQAGFQV